jgi:hypothetical protein
MNTALPFSSADSCPAPGGGGPGACQNPTPVPNEGMFTPLPDGDIYGCGVHPIPTPGSGCVAEGEVVAVPGLQRKLAGEIEIGDVVLGIAPDGSIAEQSVGKVYRSTQPCLAISAGDAKLVCSESHLLMTSLTDAVVARSVVPGTVLIDSNGVPVEVSEIRPVGHLPVVTWTCHPHHTYCAGGLLNHNKIPIPEEEIAV